MQVRPFHPEAYLLLAEIAQTAGDAPQAQLCARRSKQLVPRWKATRRYLKSRSDKNLNSKRSWPALPGINQTPSLSVCLIARNEEKHLPSCLRSIQGLPAQIVVVDTGSSDRTIEIAQSFGAEVYSFPWQDDFSAARNVSLERATSDWILILDADEELPCDQHEILKREIRNPGAMAFRLPIIDCGKEDEGHSYVPRLFRNAPGLFYVGRIHEQVLSSVEARRQQWKLDHLLGTATIQHHGYTAEIIKSRDKVARNLKLLEKAIEEFPNEPHLLMNFGMELARSGHLDEGLEQYLEAYEIMSSLPPQQVIPELRESLLTQFCSFLMSSEQFKQITEILVSPLAKSKDLTASMQFMLGVSYSKLKKFDAAIQPFKQCIARRNEKALSPYIKAIHQAGPNHCLAIAFSETKQWEQAEKAFQEAIIDDPKSIHVRFEFAEFLNKSSKPVEALTQLHLLIKENPKQLHVWILGGKICLKHPDLLEFL
ncbi:MAG TPA: glycosyltransferase, partial [Verrucomicrobiales bacterium]|nr:glycosyltransferase [Verrucomicrobiales bacterium]